MKEVTRQQAQPAAGVFVDAAGFFDTGTGNKWEGRLSPDDIQAYRARIAGLLERPDQRWLENGS
jgi:aryl sulfotransferase